MEDGHGAKKGQSQTGQRRTLRRTGACVEGSPDGGGDHRRQQHRRLSADCRGSAHDIHDSTHDSTSAEENNAIIRGGKQPHPSYLRYEYMHRDQSSLQTYGRHTPHLTPRMPLTRESARALPPPPPPSPPDTQDAVDQGTLIEVGHLYVSGPPEQQKGGGPGGVRKSCADTGYPSGRTRSVLQPPRRRWSTCQPGPT